MNGINLDMHCNFDLKDFYEIQKEFQKAVIEKAGYKDFDKTEELPIDNISVASFHCLALMEEVGELIKSDKRWKNYRNTHYDKENKKEEIADCFICLLNICLFSGISFEDLHDAIVAKMAENIERIENK